MLPSRKAEGAMGGDSLVVFWRWCMCLEVEIHQLPSLMSREGLEKVQEIFFLHVFGIDVNTEIHRSAEFMKDRGGVLMRSLGAGPASLILCTVHQPRPEPHVV